MLFRKVVDYKIKGVGFQLKHDNDSTNFSLVDYEKFILCYHGRVLL